MKAGRPLVAPSPPAGPGLGSFSTAFAPASLGQAMGKTAQSHRHLPPNPHPRRAGRDRGATCNCPVASPRLPSPNRKYAQASSPGQGVQSGHSLTGYGTSLTNNQKLPLTGPPHDSTKQLHAITAAFLPRHHAQNQRKASRGLPSNPRFSKEICRC